MVDLIGAAVWSTLYASEVLLGIFKPAQIIRAQFEPAAKGAVLPRLTVAMVRFQTNGRISLVESADHTAGIYVEFARGSEAMHVPPGEPTSASLLALIMAIVDENPNLVIGDGPRLVAGPPKWSVNEVPARDPDGSTVYIVSLEATYQRVLTDFRRTAPVGVR